MSDRRVGFPQGTALRICWNLGTAEICRDLEVSHLVSLGWIPMFFSVIVHGHGRRESWIELALECLQRGIAIGRSQELAKCKFTTNISELSRCGLDDPFLPSANILAVRLDTCW